MKFIVATAVLAFTASNCFAETFSLAVRSEEAASLQNLVDQLNSNELMLEADVQLEISAVDFIGPLQQAAEFLRDGQYAFLLTSDAGSLILPEGQELAYTSLLTEPGAFSSATEQASVQDTLFGSAVEVELGTNGLITIAKWNAGEPLLYSAELIEEPSAWEGLKIATTQSTALQALYALKASPVQISSGASSEDLINSLEAGAIDGFMVEPEFARTAFESIQKGTFVTGINPKQGFLLAEEVIWADMTEKQRAALRNAARFLEINRRNNAALQTESWLSLATQNGFAFKDYGSIAYSSRDVQADNWTARFGETGAKAFSLLEMVRDQNEFDPSSEDHQTMEPTLDPIAFATNRYDNRSNDLRYRFGLRNSDTQLRCGLVEHPSPRRRGFGKPYRGAIEVVGDSERTGPRDCVIGLNEWLGTQDDLVLYFHGYSNTFDDAIRRAIAFKRDVASSARILVWSWPSMGELGGYVYDTKSIDFSRSYLKSYAKSLVEQKLSERTVVVAHSMGSAAAIAFTEYVVDAGGELKSLIFVAPDVPVTVFSAFSNNFSSTAAEAQVVYANRNDKALWASTVANQEAPIGLASEPIVVPHATELVDVSDVAKSQIPWKRNHSHAFDIPVVSFDMFEAISTGSNARERGLTPADSYGKTYYLIRVSN